MRKGDANRLIDAVLHPLAKGRAKYPVLLLDFICHALVEKDLKKSIIKAVRYYGK